MSLTEVNGAIHLRSGHRSAHDSHRDAFAKLKVGEQLDLRVVRRLGDRSYLVSFAGDQHVMESSMPLAIGGRVRAVIVAVGDKLELQYIDSAAQASPFAEGDSTTSETAAADPGSPLFVTALEARYRVKLPAHVHDRLERAVAHAADPDAMALGGLYLGKLGAPLTEATLNALYSAQRDVAVASPAQQTGRREISTLVGGVAEGDADSTEELANVLAAALPEAAAQESFEGAGAGGSHDPGSREEREIAQLFLNLQDGGSVAYRYGTLPVIVAGQLVELDLVVLQHRPDQQSAGASIRRLVMTLKTESFGQMRVEARALDNRLLVTFAGQSPRGAEELSAYRDEVRALVSRLGWNVEAIGYELDAQPRRASRQIIDHVLAAGTVDMVL